MANIQFFVDLDLIDKYVPAEDITVVQESYQSVEFFFNINKNGSPVDLAGATDFVFALVKPDGHVVLQDDAVLENGKVKVVVNPEAFTAKGKVFYQMQYKIGTAIYNTRQAFAWVEQGNTSCQALKSTDYAPFLDQSIELGKLFGNADNVPEIIAAPEVANSALAQTNINTDDICKLENKSVEQDANLEATKELANSALNKSTENTNQIGVLSENKADKTHVDEELAKKATQSDLNVKADKTYVDTKVSAIASGSPKGTYTTLSALQTAKPTGDNNIYVVTADGKWYYWSGTAWTVGGTYQSTGIADGTVTPDKTTFIKVSTNMFNKNDTDIAKDKRVSSSEGGDTATFAGSSVSGFIPVVNGETYSYSLDKDLYGSLTNYALYGENKSLLEIKSGTQSVDKTTVTVTIANSNAKFIKTNVSTKTLSSHVFCKGSVLKPFEEYGSALDDSLSLSNTQKNDVVSLIENPDTTNNKSINLLLPKKVYVTCNDITSDFDTARQYSSNIYLDHTLEDAIDENLVVDQDISEEQDKLSFYSQASYTGDVLTINNGKTIDETTKSLSVSSYRYKGMGTVNQVSTKASASKDKFPRVLCIGDSITYGVGSSAYKSGNGEYAYWGYASKLFELDRIDGGNKPSEYNFLALGTRGAGGDVAIKYKGVEKTVRAACEGYAGWLLADILRHSNAISFNQATWDSLGLGNGSGTDYTGTLAQRNLICLTNQNDPSALPVNAFFDNTKTGDNKFSIAKWIERYRTIDDNGNRLTLGNGTGSQITASNINTYNVCTPTHIVVTIGRNDLAYCDENTFIQNMNTFISQVKSELPSVTIGIVITPDDVGSMFPKRYKNIIDCLKVGSRKFYSLASRLITEYGNKEAENIYLVPFYFVQPTAWGQPLYRVDMPESIFGLEGFQNDSFLKYRPLGVGANIHPGSHCQAAWGYQLYSWLKYVLSK